MKKARLAFATLVIAASSFLLGTGSAKAGDDWDGCYLGGYGTDQAIGGSGNSDCEIWICPPSGGGGWSSWWCPMNDEYCYSTDAR